MQNQVSDAFVRIQSNLTDVKKSIVSVPSPSVFLPQISDILSEMSAIVSSVHQADVNNNAHSDEELWWDSSPECVAYSDSDEESSIPVSTIQFTSSCSLMSSLSSISAEPDQAKIFIDKILFCVSRAAPGDIFSRRKYKRRREKLMRSLVHPELFSVWQNSSQLNKDYKIDSVRSAPLYPTIQLRDVNVRALANIPRPRPFPVSGCSVDPAHYNKVHSPITNTGYQQDSISFGPIGYLYGYETIHGIVPVPDHPIHGYIWDHVKGDWILHSDVSSKEPGRGRPHSRNQRG